MLPILFDTGELNTLHTVLSRTFTLEINSQRCTGRAGSMIAPYAVQDDALRQGKASGARLGGFPWAYL